MTQAELVRFIEKVHKIKGGCWKWTGSQNGKGYGHLRHKGKYPLAHRLMYEHYRGKIPLKMTLDHLCRTPICVNPKHLEAVSFRENVLRGVGFAAINARKVRCPSGHPYDGRLASGARRCKTCLRIQWHRWYQGHKKEKAARTRAYRRSTPVSGGRK